MVPSNLHWRAFLHAVLPTDRSAPLAVGNLICFTIIATTALALLLCITATSYDDPHLADDITLSAATSDDQNSYFASSTFVLFGTCFAWFAYAWIRMGVVKSRCAQSLMVSSATLTFLGYLGLGLTPLSVSVVVHYTTVITAVLGQTLYFATATIAYWKGTLDIKLSQIALLVVGVAGGASFIVTFALSDLWGGTVFRFDVFILEVIGMVLGLLTVMALVLLEQCDLPVDLDFGAREEIVIPPGLL